MPSINLSQAQIRSLKSKAQTLEPTLHVGKAGLTPAFLQNVEEALGRLELVKVKFAAHKEEKKLLAPELAEKSGSALVTLIGNVAVLYRRASDPAKVKIKI